VSPTLFYLDQNDPAIKNRRILAKKNKKNQESKNQKSANMRVLIPPRNGASEHGGLDIEDNLQLLCFNHHRLVHERHKR
jgi:hypothetical protein